MTNPYNLPDAVLKAARVCDDLQAVLAEIPTMEARYAERGIPREIFLHTLSDLAIWVEHCHRTTGGIGITSRTREWMGGHLRAELFRLGRMQYRVRPFDRPLRVFRKGADGPVAALYGADTQIGSGRATGHPVNPDGHVEPEPVSLDLTEWIPVLKPGDNFLDVHIPEDGPLTPEAALDSFRKAEDFFPHYFPEKSWNAFACFSWLLDPILPSLLPPESNIVKFIRLFHIFPLESEASEIVWRVFGREAVDPATAPRKTSLQRAVLDHLARGGVFRSASGFRLRSHKTEAI